MAILPQGRGQYQGPDGDALQNQDYVARRNLLPKTDGMLLSLADSELYVLGTVADVAILASTFLAPIGYLERNYTLTKMRYAATIVGTTAVLTTGLFQLNIQDRQLVLLAGTKVVTAINTTGRTTVSLAYDVTIPADTYVYIASLVTAAVAPTVLTFQGGAAGDVPISFYTPTPIDVFPNKVKTAELALPAVSLRVPQIQYLSTAGAEIL